MLRFFARHDQAPAGSAGGHGQRRDSWVPQPQPQREQRHEHDGELAELDADVECHARRHHVRCASQQAAQHSAEAEAVDQTEAKRETGGLPP